MNVEDIITIVEREVEKNDKTKKEALAFLEELRDKVDDLVTMVEDEPEDEREKEESEEEDEKGGD